jgi:hypothetical protein
MERFGLDFEVEVERMRMEDTLRENTSLIEKAGPFYEPATSDDSEPSDDAPSIPRGQPGQGRPPNTPDDEPREKKQTPRDPVGRKVAAKPVNMMELFDLQRIAGEMYDQVDNIITSIYLQSKNIDNKRKLSHEQKTELDTLIFQIFSGLDANKDKDVCRSRILELIDAGPRFDRCVKNAFDGLVKKFTRDKGRSPAAKERRDLRSSAFAICTSQFKKSGIPISAEINHINNMEE